MRESSPLDPGYGGHIWLNKERSADAKQVLFPGRGPSSLFACVGHRGQYILISPAQGLTIVRLGISDEEEQPALRKALRSEEHTSELQSLMRISYAVFCLKKKTKNQQRTVHT